jgi:hypothetical protein
MNKTEQETEFEKNQKGGQQNQTPVLNNWTPFIHSSPNLC